MIMSDIKSFSLSISTACPSEKKSPTRHGKEKGVTSRELEVSVSDDFFL